MGLVRFIKFGMITVLSLSLVTGCAGVTSASKNTGSTMDTSLENSGEIIECGSDLVNSVEIPEFDIIGEVLEIDGNKVHILFGDIVEIFEVTNASEVYLGETVQVVGEKGKQSLKPFLIESFTIKHTNMGHIIEIASGWVVGQNKDTLTIKTDQGEMVFETFDEVQVGADSPVQIEYVHFNGPEGEKTLLKVLPLDLTMTMTVEGIERTDKGLLVFKGIEDNGMESFVDIKPGTNDNFNLSELKIGDRVEVIPELVMESYPMQVTPLRVRLVEKLK